MITLYIMPNFKGTTNEKLWALAWCLVVDMMVFMLAAKI